VQAAEGVEEMPGGDVRAAEGAVGMLVWNERVAEEVRVLGVELAGGGGGIPVGEE
jgi:hypothetical protein